MKEREERRKHIVREFEGKPEFEFHLVEACDYATVADDEFADAYLMKGHSFFQLGNEESVKD